MRLLKRNERVFYYANPVGIEKIRDDEGYLTGEKRVLYSEPIKLKGNIGPATGAVSIEQFGSVEAYDKVIVLCDPDLDVNMSSVFWIDQLPADPKYGLSPDAELEPSGSLTPADGSSGAVDYDYIIGHISRSLTSISIAVKAVDVR